MNQVNLLGSRRRAGALPAVIAAACIVVGTHTGAVAAPAPAQVTGAISPIGSVDLQKVLNGYNKKNTADAQMKAQVDQYNAAFNIQQTDVMLSVADQQSLGTLLLKPTKTSADQAQIQALQARSQADATELTALQQKASPTPVDTTRLAALTKEQQDGQAALHDISDSYRQLLDQKNQQEADVLAADVKSAVAAVAQQRGLAVVFDSSLAIYASNDVTQLVINHLNALK